MPEAEDEREGSKREAGERRRAGLVLARAGALALSISTVAFLMFRAGGAGCASTAETHAQPDTVDVGAPATTQPTPVDTQSTPPPAATSSEPGMFMGGSKAGIIPVGKEPPAPDPAPAVEPSASSPSSEPVPRFPASKSGRPF